MPTPELYKDKVEVSLDGRQIFYLFFGGATIVGIVFVLGVLVGRRVEARGHVDHARTQTATDPLAALDRLEGSGGLSFQGSLTGKDAPSSVEKTIDDLEKNRAAKLAIEPKKPDAAKPEAKVELKVEPKKPDEPKLAPKQPEEAKAGPVVKPEGDKKPENKPDAKPRKDADVASDAKSEAKPEKKPEPKVADADAKPEPKADPEIKSRYTLQLSSFQDRAEAETFLASVKAQGFTAQITQAEVEGKGTFYRVRTGTYRSLEAATSAKSELEKAGKSASIMKL